MDEAAFHDRFYAGDAERIFGAPLYRALLARQVAFLRAVTPGAGAARVLSIGCGDGRRELLMAPHVGEIVAVDVSPTAIRAAQARAGAQGAGNVTFRVEDGRALATPAGPAFDAIWCAGVLHHLDAAARVALVRGAFARLRPGGAFVSMDPNAWRAVNAFKPLLRRTYARYHSPGETELRPAAVVALVRAAGGTAVAVHFVDAFISPLAWAFPRATAPVAPLLAGLDGLLVRLPGLRWLSSGFAVVARRGAGG